MYMHMYVNNTHSLRAAVPYGGASVEEDGITHTHNHNTLTLLFRKSHSTPLSIPPAPLYLNLLGA